MAEVGARLSNEEKPPVPQTGVNTRGEAHNGRLTTRAVLSVSKWERTLRARGYPLGLLGGSPQPRRGGPRDVRGSPRMRTVVLCGQE